MIKMPIGLLAICLSACQLKQTRIPLKTGMEGKPLAQFEFLLPDGLTEINTDSIPRGKPVVLIYFSPYCPFCRAEISDVVKNIKVLAGARVYMVTNFPLRTLISFDSVYHIDRNSKIITGQDVSRAFLIHYKSPGIPVTAIFDSRKNLKQAFVGRMTAEQIAEVAGLY